MGQKEIFEVEVVDDPGGLGYAGMTDGGVIVALYEVGLGAQTLPVEAVLSQAIIEATVLAEYNALSTTEKDRYDLFISAGSVNPAGPNTKAAFASMFGPGTTTRDNLLALAERPVSRAEIIGLSKKFREYDVTQARTP